MEDRHDDLVVILAVTVAGLSQHPFPPKTGMLLHFDAASIHSLYRQRDPMQVDRGKAILHNQFGYFGCVAF
jgi:hypothetical protein